MTREPRADVVVAGGGVTGLVAAHALARAGLHVTLLEREARVGGVVASTREHGFLAEHGPNSAVRTPALERLAAELGIAGELVEPGAGGRRRYVVRGGRPHALPASPVGLLRTPLLSARGKLRLLLEPWIAATASEHETVAAFVRRRLGAEVLEQLVEPFVGGVYAGDPERLGVAQAFPRLRALEREHGSLLRGAARARARAKAGGERLGPPASVSFRDGLGTLPRALAARLGDRVRTGAPLRAVRRVGDRWRLSVGQLGATHELEADALVWAAPAHAIRTVEWPGDVRDEAMTIGDVRHAAIATVTLGYRREQVRHPLDGFGMLVPAREGRSLLGALFTSSLFPGRAPVGHVTLTCFAGGSRDPGLAVAPVATVVRRVRDDLASLLGVEGEPAWMHHTAWAQGIPQYETVHQRVRDAAARMEARHAGLYLAGQALDGVALSDCIDAGERAAARVLAARRDAAVAPLTDVPGRPAEERAASAAFA